MSTPPHYLTPLLSERAAGASLIIERSGRALAERVEPAFTSKARNRGLLGRDGLDAGAALVIAPSNSIHTFFMRFPIDVVYTDRAGRVLKIKAALPPWRLSACRRGFAVVELAAGSAVRTGLRVGDRLSCRIERSGD
jgi:uncharacterized membrane protein (UPF0127 family)